MHLPFLMRACDPQAPVLSERLLASSAHAVDITVTRCECLLQRQLCLTVCGLLSDQLLSGSACVPSLLCLLLTPVNHSAERVKTAEPSVALVSAEGTVCVQVLSRELAVPVEGEGELLQAKLHSIM